MGTARPMGSTKFRMGSIRPGMGSIRPGMGSIRPGMELTNNYARTHARKALRVFGNHNTHAKE